MRRASSGGVAGKTSSFTAINDVEDSTEMYAFVLKTFLMRSCKK